MDWKSSVKLPTLTRRAKPVAADPEYGLVQVGTRFDFLSGAFQRAERGRKLFFVICVVGVLLLGAIAMVGFSAHQDAETLDAETANLTQVQTTKQKELAQLDQAEGIPADSLRAHASTRHRELLGIIGNDLDVNRLVSGIMNATPNSIAVQSIAVTDPAVGTPAGQNAGDQNAAPAPQAATGSVGAAPGQTRTLTIVGSVPGFAEVRPWVARVSGIPGITKVTPNWAGGSGSLTVTLTAEVTQSLLTERSRTATAADQYGLAPTAQNQQQTAEGSN